ncbi:MAG TPA: HAD-IA family hydrolase [Luteolibacter sp.]|nr:HAD-IA family hydrolase [Luteolibacter sp.]
MKLGLIFDLDGTLVDSLPGIAASLNHALEVSGFPGHVHADVRRFIGNGSWVLAKRAAPAGTPDEVIGGIEAAFKVHYDATWNLGTAPYAGVPELLVELQKRGHRLAVLSNKPHPFTRAIVDSLFPGITFDVVVGQRAGIPHKPDPAGAFEVVKAFGLPPEDCVLIGDSTIDLETARNAGIGSVAVTWGYHDRAPLEAASPDALVDDVASLLAALG